MESFAGHVGLMKLPSMRKSFVNGEPESWTPMERMIAGYCSPIQTWSHRHRQRVATIAARGIEGAERIASISGDHARRLISIIFRNETQSSVTCTKRRAGGQADFWYESNLLKDTRSVPRP